MILSDFITRVNYRLRGTDDNAPAVGSEDYAYWVDTLNMKKNELYEDVAKQWSNTFQLLELGTVTASAAPEFDLEDAFLTAASSAYIIDTNGIRHDIELIKPQETSTALLSGFIAGQDPQVLRLSNAVLADSNLVGGTLYLPAYVMPDDLKPSQTGATIPIPDPNWAVYAVAAELAANSLEYEDKEANLVAKANNLYRLMAKKSTRGSYGNPRRTPYNVTRIGQRHQ